jgi:hypothetical protein
MARIMSLQHGFAGVACDGFAGGVAEANQVAPARGLGAGRGCGGNLRVNGWREGDGYAGGSGEDGSFAKELAGSGQGNRDDWGACAYGCFEGA